MSYGRECPYCGDMLDPGEKCQCRDAKIARGEAKPRRRRRPPAARADNEATNPGASRATA